jgi:hypothetical protein
VSDDGLAGFAVHYTYIRDPNSLDGSDPLAVFVLDKNGVFTSNGTSVTRIADDSSHDTGLLTEYPADGYFSVVVPLTTMSEFGDMVFQGTFVTTSSSWRGVFVVRDGTLYRVIDSRTGQSWPGLPSGAQFLGRTTSTGYAVGVGPAGHIVLAGRLASGGTTNSAVLLWDWSTLQWYQLTGPGGAAATALVSSADDAGEALILSGANPYLADSSGRTQLNSTLPSALQGATLVWLDAGGSVNNNGRAAVPYTNSGDDGLALWTTEKLLVIADAHLGSPANLAEIHTVLGPERDRPGRSGLLNDSDDSTFRAVLADNSEAIYLAKAQ